VFWDSFKQTVFSMKSIIETSGPQQKKYRFALRPVVLTAFTTLFVLVAYNATFWTRGLDVFIGHEGAFAVFGVALYFLTLAFFALFSLPYLVKPFLIFILILSAVTSYFMDTLGVMIDREMIQNAMVTTLTESKHLITIGFISHVVLYGILPSIVVAVVHIKPARPLARFGMPLLVSALAFVATVGLLLTDYKTYSAVLRQRKELMGSYQPGAPLVGTVRYAKMMMRSANVVVQPIGLDAKKGASYGNGRKPVLTLVIAGETARAQNFSLNGYEVETNPELAQQNIINFKDVNSCGTATAVSLPCMFSKFDRAQYSYQKGISNQSLVDVIDHAGFNVEWWDNNTGDKGVAARVKTLTLNKEDNAEFCGTGECMDGIFLEKLKEYAQTITTDTVLFMHQIGSHGPTYHLRYPDEFERFKPACRTAEFKNCTPQEIVNSFDNTILYTDHVLSQTIDFLKTQDNLVTSMVYVSDHGESLGEFGLYLHGSPYFMAPEFQTKVPMILWMSPEYQKRFGIDAACLEAKTEDTLAHANLFHSVLGLLDIQTSERQPELDIFATCKSGGQAPTQ